jgi:serine/threonine protein kinase
MGDKIPSDCIDLLHKLFELSPVRRISAADAIKHTYFTSIDKDWMNKSSVNTKQSNVNRTTETTSPCTINNLFFFNKKIN